MCQYIQTSKLLIASSIVLMTMSSAMATDTVSQNITDVRQETQIWTTYALNPYLRANDLKVSVHNGKATLTGKVEEDVNRDLAKEIALGVSGVKEVDNRIVVQPDYIPPVSTSTRSYGQLIDDATITAAVKSKLMWNKHTNGLASNVDTKWGKVTLHGTVDSTAAKESAGRLAMNTRGVVSVDNQLTVNSAKPTAMNTAKHSAEAVGQDIADSWITAKVKSTLMYSSNVNSFDIAVNTQDGIVMLSGKLNSGAERALAIELAKNVRGVKSVHSKNLTF